MDTLSKRLDFLMEKFGRTYLVENTDLSQSQLYRIRSGASTSLDSALSIWQACGCSLQWLAAGIGEPFPDSEVRDSSAVYRAPIKPKQKDTFSEYYALIPVLNVEASAGNGAVTESEEVAAVYAYRRDWLRDTLGASAEDLRIITVQGESMAPTLRSGELIFVDTRLDRFTGDGIYILRMGDDVLVKHVQRLPGQVLRVTSENTNYASFDIKLDEASNDEVAIVGRVVWAVSGRRI